MSAERSRHGLPVAAAFVVLVVAGGSSRRFHIAAVRIVDMGAGVSPGGGDIAAGAVMHMGAVRVIAVLVRLSAGFAVLVAAGLLRCFPGISAAFVMGMAARGSCPGFYVSAGCIVQVGAVRARYSLRVSAAFIMLGVVGAQS